MAKRVPPYHSKADYHPKVHHVFSDCTVGNNIESYNKVPGEGGYPLCKTCRDMGA
jgi:hypothetical protein